jgi:hypothetical protein
MALVKHNNNSISDLTSAGQLAQGKMTLISEQTASGSASVEFTSGIDSTYPVYKFELINIHPSADANNTHMSASTDGGSSYGVTATTTQFQAKHNEADNDSALQYSTAGDLAQSTNPVDIGRSLGSGNDECGVATIFIFNPSSTTFVKHFISTNNEYHSSDLTLQNFTAGYFNTTSAIDGIQFSMSSGNIDAGTIKLYGIKGD